MLNKIKQKSDRGFTLLELIVALFIFGIITAIAAPNFIGLLNRTRVDASLEKLVGAIKETQRQAMRLSQRCRINIDPNTNMLTATPNDCLLNAREIDKNVDIRTNIRGRTPSIFFSHKGSTTKMGTIVLSSDLTNTQKCFVISLGLGIVRTGNYTGSKTGSVSPTECIARQPNS